MAFFDPRHMRCGIWLPFRRTVERVVLMLQLSCSYRCWLVFTDNVDHALQRLDENVNVGVCSPETVSSAS